MNIKFKMPKFQKMTTKGGIVREMLMTVIATSISIVLTFGTAMYIENRNKKEVGRQMAMMVIHDMDVNIEAFKEAAKEQGKNGELLDFLIDHPDQIDSISEDSLGQVWNYLLNDELFIIDDSKEKIFNSSQDTWKNIDSPLFIDLIQDFYLKRRFYHDYMSTERSFRSPISKEDEYEMMLNAPSYYLGYDREQLRTLVNDKRVRLFATYSLARQRYLEKAAGDWQRMSDQCKFIMDITDEELKEYIDKQTKTGEPVKESELIGTWSDVSTIGDHEESIIFNRDHTFIHLRTRSLNSSTYSGSIFYTYHYRGKWRIEGDSLIREFDKGRFSELDTTQISYTAAMRDTVGKFIAHLKEQVARNNEAGKEVVMGRKSNAATIDKSGNKIELPYVTVSEDGKEEVEYNYMTRKNKK